MCTDAFVEVAAENTRDLQQLYGRPVALELAPTYQQAGDMESEVHFLDAVAGRAEMFGRRIQAAQDLLNAFSQTLSRWVPEPPATDRQLVQLDWFIDFLGSDHFYEPDWSLPTHAGMGRGYEGFSRFFFWARERFGLRQPSADLLLRDDLYLDMAAALDNHKVGAVDPRWERLSQGFFRRVHPAEQAPCRGLTADRQVFRTGLDETADVLSHRGLCDLDGLQP